MQFQGGYRYSSGWICTVLSILAIVGTVTASYRKSLALCQILTLFLNLEGTVLLASAFSPVGLTPPQGGPLSMVKWFLAQQGGVPMSYNQPMFYGGLLCLFVAQILSAVLR